MLQQCCVNGQAQVPGVFVFGGTLSDHGNNNNLRTSVKSNYMPYGIDFSRGSTGRFSNGKTQVDIIAEFLRLNTSIPPYANTTGSDILKGVTYASGSAGIRDETGRHLGNNINFRRQIANHRYIILRILSQIGYNRTRQHLRQCLYYVHIGNNDYIYNYYLPQFYRTSRFFNTEQFAQDLINRYSRYIQDLRSLGARKFVFISPGRIGCTPYALSMNRTNGSCVEEMNAATSIFTGKLRSLVDRLNNNFGDDSRFMFVNNSARNLGVVATGGFTVTNASCCPTGTDLLCDPNQTPCQNRNQYVFWDKFVFTEAFNRFLALLAYNGSNRDFVYPVNISTLVQS
ncbi:GDSL esterase/lipase At1g29670-like [Vigna umbellata]|uniref:GDSL esterase/lipase At1g29670-like n=1 Tax=Vigna umbellata TaxID=87088 RepID=UPI001F5F7BAB|nr:GDSL esterase/lipase At1g29670-like [Vigna umbellata]